MISLAEAYDSKKEREKRVENAKAVSSSLSDAYSARKSSTAQTTLSLADAYARKKSAPMTVDAVSDWVASASALGERAYTYYSAEGWKAPNTQLVADLDRQLEDASKVRRFFADHQSEYENGAQLATNVNNLIANLKRMRLSAVKQNQVYSQYTDAASYEDSLKAAREYEENATYDLEGTAGAFLQKTDIVSRQTDRNALYERMVVEKAKQLRADITSSGLVGTSKINYEDLARKQIDSDLEDMATLDPNSAKYREMSGSDLYRIAEYDRVNREALAWEGYDDYDTFKTAYDQEDRKRKVAAYIQKGIELYNDATSAVDFKEKSQYDPDARYGLEYKFINGEALTAEAMEKLPSLLKNIRQYMSSDEIAVYNYYRAKKGKDAADKYLEVIEDALSSRKASELFGDLEGKWGLEQAFGIVAGLDQFAGGLKNFLSDREDYIPASAVQKTSAQVREDLYGDGGVGGSVSRGIYDVISSAANMAPSVLSSVAAGYLTQKVTGNPVLAGKVSRTVGSGLMSASASGNAYAEAINNGYSKEQTRLYSTLIGVSETCLQTVLSGIPQLGGAATSRVLKAIDTVDNALFRVPLKIGASILSEGTEEGLQEMLTPLFKRIAADEQASVDWGAVAESFVIGGLVGVLYSAPQITARDIQQTRVGNTYLESEQLMNGLKDLALRLPTDSEAYTLAQELTDDTGAYRVGELFKAMCEEFGVSEKVGAAAVVGNAVRLTAERADMESAPTDNAGVAEVTEADIADFNAKMGMPATAEEFAEADRAVTEDSAAVEAVYAEREAGGVKYTPPTAKNIKAYSTADTEVYSKALSRTVYMYDGASHAQAEAGFAENGAVYINKNAPVNRNSVAVVLAHEYTHTIEGTKAYAKLADTVFKSKGYAQMLATAGKNGEISLTHEEYLQQIINDYDKGGAKLGETAEQKRAGAEKEAVAKYLSEYLFQNVEKLTDLARTDRTIFEKIRAAVRRFIARLHDKTPNKRDLIKLERLFTKAAKAANTAAQMQKSPATTSGVQYHLPISAESVSIKDQIREHLDELNAMESAADISYGTTTKEAMRNRVISEFQRLGGKIDRKNFGIIEIGAEEVKTASNYVETQAEIAAWLTVPRVLKRGILIHTTENHKDRGHPTFTIAAPVTINGTRGIVAVIVKKTGRNRYKSHRIVMPDGSAFTFEHNKNAESTGSDMLTKDSDQGTDINSAFGYIIPDSSEKNNPQFSLPDDPAYMDAVNRGDMETAQRMVDEAPSDGSSGVKYSLPAQTPSYLELTPEQRLERDTKDASRLLERKHVVDNAPPEVAPVLERIMDALDEVRATTSPQTSLVAATQPTAFTQSVEGGGVLDAPKQSADTSVSTDQSAVVYR